jgi:anti-sigma factor RsiW
MNCAKFDSRLPELADGQLGAVGTWRLKRHLRCCPRCRTKLDALTAVLDGVRELRAPEQSDRFWENLHKRVMASLPPEPRPRVRNRPSLRLVPAFAAAAVALVMVLVLKWPTGNGEWAPEDWAGEELFGLAPWQDLSEDDLAVVLEEMEEDQTWPSDGSAAVVSAEDETPWEAIDLLSTEELVALLGILEKRTDTANA